MDITTEVSMLSTHNSLPREGHLNAVFRIFSYLKTKGNAQLVLDLTYAGIDCNTFQQHNWGEFYGDGAECTNGITLLISFVKGFPSYCENFTKTYNGKSPKFGQREMIFVCESGYHGGTKADTGFQPACTNSTHLIKLSPFFLRSTPPKLGQNCFTNLISPFDSLFCADRSQ
jgi:hypothetical protein